MGTPTGYCRIISELDRAGMDRDRRLRFIYNTISCILA